MHERETATTKLAALSAAFPAARTVGYGLELNGQLRMTLFPDEVAPLLGLTAEQIRLLCRTGLLRFRNLHPGEPQRPIPDPRRGAAGVPRRRGRAHSELGELIGSAPREGKLTPT